MHEAGGERTQGDELFAVQRLDLIGLQALRAVGEDNFAHRGAAGKQGPEILLAEAKQHGILHRQDAEHGRGPAGEQWGFAKAIAGACGAHQSPGSIPLGALGAGFALED